MRCGAVWLSDVVGDEAQYGAVKCGRGGMVWCDVMWYGGVR